MGFTENMPLETVQELSSKLYATIFKSDSFKIKKAVMLRTFLYYYKSQIQKNETTIPPTDQLIMLDLAKASEKYLIAGAT